MSRLDAAARAGIAEWDRVEPNNPVSASFVASHVDSIKAALAAADAHDAANGVHRVTPDDATVERVAQALTAHAVITDGLAEGSGWCAECGNVDPDDDHEARNALAAAVKERQ